jgi:hypothetical protein
MIFSCQQIIFTQKTLIFPVFIGVSESEYSRNALVSIGLGYKCKNKLFNCNGLKKIFLKKFSTTLNSLETSQKNHYF